MYEAKDYKTQDSSFDVERKKTFKIVWCSRVIHYMNNLCNFNNWIRAMEISNRYYTNNPLKYCFRGLNSVSCKKKSHEYNCCC